MASLFLLSACGFAAAQSNGCPAPPAMLKPNPVNLFNDQQEVWLGDATADYIEHRYALGRNAEENAYLDKIGQRLLAALPPTGIRFKFVLQDSVEINGLSLAGGRVYLTRKLVSNARSEDEVAGVVAHEIGHVLTHQAALYISDQMRRLMNVTSVGDRNDVYDKFRTLTDVAIKAKDSDHGLDEDDSQDEADAVAVYAMAAAGYAPSAYPEFWDRSFFVQGKTGSSLTDFFRMTKPSQRRLRNLRKLVAALPKSCGATATTTSAEFKEWQAMVTANQPSISKVEETAERAQTLDPPLRMDLQRIRFSPDGKYLFAQDESSVFVLQAEPLKLLFRFDAEDARPAHWSPDAQSIVFHTERLHTEQWDVAAQKLKVAHEVVSREDCLQTELSPDGRTLFCISAGEFLEYTGWLQFDLRAIDTETSKEFFEKKGFFSAPYFDVLWWDIRHSHGDVGDAIYKAFSPDGNYLIIGNDERRLAFDLRTRQSFKINGEFNKATKGAYAFQGSKLAGVGAWDAGTFSFPDGARLTKSKIGMPQLESLTKSDTLVTKNKDGDFVILNLAEEKIFYVMKTPAVDLYGDLMASEMIDGSVAMAKIDAAGTAKVQSRIPLPLSPLGRIRVAALSRDGRYLTASGKSRGAVWDVSTGKRIYLLHGFQGAVFEPDGKLYLDIAKFEKMDRAIVSATLDHVEMHQLALELTDKIAMNSGRLLEWKDAEKGKLNLIVRSPVDGKELWTRSFEKEKPNYTYNFSDSNYIFTWKLKSAAGKVELKSHPELVLQAAALKDKEAGVLVEVVDRDNGKLLQTMVLEAPPTFSGTGGLDQVQETLLVSTKDNRTLLYSMKTGALVKQVFGYVIAVDQETGRFCVRNRHDEAIVYDQNGAELAQFHPGTTVRVALFQNKATKLLVLGSDQKVRVMRVEK